MIGQITVARFINPEGLRAELGNRYSETSASGLPITAVPGTNAAGALRQRTLEQCRIWLDGNGRDELYRRRQPDC